jgi:hypothetical protein
MRSNGSIRMPDGICARVVLVLVLFGLTSAYATADDLLGLYAGGAIGQSHLEATGQRTYASGNVYYDTGSFNENHTGFKVFIGIRPISLVGAEIAYVDFGRPTGGFGSYPADVSMKGASAFGILYLPVPMVNVFLKAGVARIVSEINGTSIYGPNCPASVPCPLYVGIAHFQLNRTNTSGAGGVGAQYNFGPLAVRAEYERFNASGGHPGLFSAGLSWTFF